MNKGLASITLCYFRRIQWPNNWLSADPIPRAEFGARIQRFSGAVLGRPARTLPVKTTMAKKSNAEFVKWFGPVLDALRDLGDSGRPREVYSRIAENLAIPDEILDETLKSGASRFQNQVAWARQYLVWEGLVDSS